MAAALQLSTVLPVDRDTQSAEHLPWLHLVRAAGGLRLDSAARRHRPTSSIRVVPVAGLREASIPLAVSIQAAVGASPEEH